jgi:hypothetical protein
LLLAAVVWAAKGVSVKLKIEELVAIKEIWLLLHFSTTDARKFW